MKYAIERSSQVDERNMKILFWGDTGTRKTETILRNFPRVLLIDTEFNSDQAVDVPEIPEFMRYQTKDIRVIMEIIDEIKHGKLLFFDGQPIETFAIDSVTVLYSTAQEFGYKIAENRALKYNRDISTANMTQGDWAMIKRPLKQLQNQINGTGIRYLCMTAREKPLYEENEQGELKKHRRGRRYRQGSQVRNEPQPAVWLFPQIEQVVLQNRQGAGCFEEHLPHVRIWRGIPHGRAGSLHAAQEDLQESHAFRGRHR